MQNFIFSILLVSSTFLLTGCFELLEVVNLEKDGRGSMKLILNMSRSRNVVEEFMSKDSIQGVAVPTAKTIIEGLEYAKLLLQASEGIHNANYKADLENYIITFSAEFDSIQAINNAYDTLFHKKPSLKDLFVYSCDEFCYSRSVNHNVLTKIKSYYNMLLLYGINDANFTTIIRSENSIDSVSFPGNISANGKTMMEKKSIQQLINKQYTQLTLKFK